MSTPVENQLNDSRMHHRRTLRINSYDYSQAGVYFVTVCTYKKQPLFGKIHNGKIRLSDIGEFVKQCWIVIPRHFINVGCDKFVIMPNHIHGIIIINEKNTLNGDEKIYKHNASRRGKACLAPTRDKPYFNVVPGSLGAIVRSFKSAVTKFAHTRSEYSNIPIWQRNYYEHVIRNEADLSEKRKYIIDNPAKWNEDEYYLNESDGGLNK